MKTLPRSAQADSESALNSMRRVFHALRAWAQEAETGSGISGAQLFVLQQLGHASAPSLKSLAQRTLTSTAAVSVVVSRLVGRGLVRRQASRLDGRRVVLTLTAAGRSVLSRAPEAPQLRVLSALRRMPRRELAAFARQFERFVDELGIGTLEPRMLFEGTNGDGQPLPNPHSRNVSHRSRT